MERLDLLVRAARDATGNQTYTATSGIKQREFVRHFNAAQMRLLNRILQERSTLLTKQSYIDAVAGTAEYTLPTDVFFKQNILKIEYSHDGTAQNYSPLELRTPHEEVSVRGYPSSYYFRDGTLIVSPIPSNSVTNAFRLLYQKTLPTLDIRRGKISSVATGGGYVTSVTLDTATVITESSDDLANGWVDHVSVCDADGTIKTQTTGCPVSSYVASTGVLTFTASTVPTSANTPVANNYVVFGKYSTTHSQLVDPAERYLVEYAVLRTQMRDSNVDAAEQSPLLQAIEREILDAVAELEEDLPAIPILTQDFLNYDESL